MIERARYFSWYVFVFLLPWQTVWILREVFVGGEKWQYATVGLYASDVALVACAVFLVARASHDVWQEIMRDAFSRIFFALFVWTLLSILWAMEKDLAFLSAWRIFLMMLAYIGVRYGGVPFRKTLTVFLFSMTIHAGLALSQWAMQDVFGSTLLGIAPHEVWRPGTVVLKTESGRFLRAYGGFEHPNVLGGALAIAALFGVWLSAMAKRIVSRVVFLGMTIVSSFALVFTFSRSAWMAFGAGVGIVMLRVTRRFFLVDSDLLRFCFSWRVRFLEKNNFFACLPLRSKAAKKQFFSKKLLLKKKLLGIFFVVFVAVLSFSVSFFLVHDIALSRFSDETLVREGSLSDRAVYMRQALVAIGEHPMLGVGGGNFTAFSRLHFPSEGRFVGDFQPVHAVPILVFVELGVVGFVLFALLFVFAFVRAWKEKNVFAVIILCALLPLSLLDHWLWSGHFGAVFLGLLFGINALSFSASPTLTREWE